jgi:hypothetical protein
MYHLLLFWQRGLLLDEKENGSLEQRQGVGISNASPSHYHLLLMQSASRVTVENNVLPMINTDDSLSLMIILTAFSSALHAPMVWTPSLIVCGSKVGGRDASETSFPLMPAMTSNWNPVIEEESICASSLS